MFIPMLAALRWTRLSSGQAALPRRSRSLRDSVPCLGGRRSRISRQTTSGTLNTCFGIWVASSRRWPRTPRPLS